MRAQLCDKFGLTWDSLLNNYFQPRLAKITRTRASAVDQITALQTHWVHHRKRKIVR